MSYPEHGWFKRGDGRSSAVFYIFELVTEVFDISLESFLYDHLSLGRVEGTIVSAGGAILVGDGVQLDT